MLKNTVVELIDVSPLYEFLEFDDQQKPKPFGTGITSEIFKVRQKSLGIVRALKVIRKELADNQEFIEFFNKEIEKLSIITHSNVVKIVDRGTIWGRPCYIMDYISGGTLWQYLESKPSEIPEEEFWDILRQILSGLNSLHEIKIYHMDLKLNNILMEKNIPKICDLGFAKHYNEILPTGYTKVLPTENMDIILWKKLNEQLKANPNQKWLILRRKELVSLGSLHDLFSFGKILISLRENRNAPIVFKQGGAKQELYTFLVNRLTHEDPKNRYQNCSEVLTIFKKFTGFYSSIAGIPELGPPQYTYSIRLPKEIILSPYSKRMSLITDHPIMQRLRNIRQLPLTHLLYPGATHSRYEHCLGCYERAVKYINILISNHKFNFLFDDKDILSIILAALLHDVGIYPFAHAVEMIDKEFRGGIKSHEEYNQEMIEEKVYHPICGKETSISQLITSDWDVDPEVVKQLIGPRELLPTVKLRLMKSIVNGPLDADKMDYLYRDSIHTGVPYGMNFDREKLIQSLTINQTGEGLAVTEEGYVPAILFVLARVNMISEVYYHHTSRSLERMLEEAILFYIKSSQYRKDSFIEKLKFGFDEKVLDWLTEHAPDQSVDIIKMLQQRKLYKRLRTYESYYTQFSGGPPTDFIRKIYEKLRGLAKNVEKRAQCGKNLAAKLGLKENSILIDIPLGKHAFTPFEVVFEGRIITEKIFRDIETLSPMIKHLKEDFEGHTVKARIFLHPSYSPLDYSWEKVDSDLSEVLEI